MSVPASLLSFKQVKSLMQQPELRPHLFLLAQDLLQLPSRLLDLLARPASLRLAFRIAPRVFLLPSFPLCAQVSSETFCAAPYAGEVCLERRHHDALLSFPSLSSCRSNVRRFCGLQYVGVVGKRPLELFDLELLQVKCMT